MKKERCGVVAVVGEPNAGKSTLVNQMVGGKISIVSPKVQTTRFNVRGICTHGDAQIIFVDTPGIFDAGKHFEKAMVNAAWAGIGDADAVLLMIDGTRGLTDSNKQIISRLAKFKEKPVSIIINKIDKITKERLMELAAACDAAGVFDRIFMVSALKGKGTDDVKKWLASSLPEAHWLYPEEEMSDIPLRLLAAEITREKLFIKLNQELPYALFVETEQWEETKDFIRISQVIYVQRETQKKIVIGAGGDMLKRVGTAARKEIEALTGKKSHLALFVKVRENWKSDSAVYKMLGLEFNQ